MTSQKPAAGIEERYSVPQVAEALHVDKRTVRSWIATGRLRAERPGRHFKIPKSALEQMDKIDVPAPRPTSKREKKGVSG
jgi:excisionase family DNA binding protein